MSLEVQRLEKELLDQRQELQQSKELVHEQESQLETYHKYLQKGIDDNKQLQA